LGSLVSRERRSLRASRPGRLVPVSVRYLRHRPPLRPRYPGPSLTRLAAARPGLLAISAALLSALCRTSVCLPIRDRASHRSPAPISAALAVSLVHGRRVLAVRCSGDCSKRHRRRPVAAAHFPDAGLRPALLPVPTAHALGGRLLGSCAASVGNVVSLARVIIQKIRCEMSAAVRLQLAINQRCSLFPLFARRRQRHRDRGYIWSFALVAAIPLASAGSFSFANLKLMMMAARMLISAPDLQGSDGSSNLKR